ncbi:MAG: GntR family transcriptional regulator [Gammaproteobacteria bacterium]|nr:MAG: GntR family transcriptional regulator [Gammaproteobacteria bacterium]
MKKPLPAYQQIKRHILHAIHSGEWRTGMTIPAEISLANQFAVSRMTVNRALKELTEEKVLERRQGSGTFVAQQQFHHTFVEVRNIADDVRQTGKNYRAKVVSKKNCGLSALPVDRQPLFQKTQKLFQLDVVHYSDDMPIQYEKRWVDTDLVPEFSEQDFSRVNTSDYLIHTVPLVKGRYSVQALHPTADIAKRLNMATTQPALLLTRYTYSSNNHIVTYVQMWHNGNSFRFSGEL